MKLTREQERTRTIASKVMLALEDTSPLHINSLVYLASIRYVESINGSRKKGNVKRYNGMVSEVIDLMTKKGYLNIKGKMVYPTEAGFYSLKKWRAVMAFTNYYRQSYWIPVSTILDWFGNTASEFGITEEEMIQTLELYEKPKQKEWLENSLELLEKFEVLVKKDGKYYATDLVDEIFKFI